MSTPKKWLHNMIPTDELLEDMIEDKRGIVYTRIKNMKDKFPSFAPHMEEMRVFIDKEQYTEAACFMYRLKEAAIVEHENTKEREEYRSDVINLYLFVTALQFEKSQRDQPNKVVWERVHTTGKRAVVIRNFYRGIGSS